MTTVISGINAITTSKSFVKHLVVFIQLRQNTELKMPKTDHTICVNICHTVFLWWLKIFLILCGCEIIHSFHWALYELWFFPCKVRKTIKKTLLCEVSRGYATNKRDLKTSLCQKKRRTNIIELLVVKCQLVKNLSQKILHWQNQDMFRLEYYHTIYYMCSV